MRRFLEHAAPWLGLAVLVFAVWWTGYQGRVDMQHSQVRGCERGKLDRAANAAGWRTAQVARLATAANPNAEVEERRNAWKAAQTYSVIASGLEQRSRIDCSEVFPPARVLPV